MPSTASGTAYTTRTADLGVHGVCVWTVADSKLTDVNLPAILYAHGSQGDADQLVSLPAWNGLRDWLIDKGFVLIEGDGGRVYGKGNWGGPEAQAAYTAYLAYVEGLLSIGGVVLLGRSMGGLVTAWLAARYSGRSRFAGWINNSGVSTMFVGRSTPDSPPAVTEENSPKATGLYFSPRVWESYGATSYTDLQSKAADHAPELWPQSSWDGLKILSLWGTADPAVPPAVRGAEALRPRWSGRASIDRVYVRPGGVHAGTNTSYYDVAPMVAFIQEVLGLAPAPVDRGSLFREVLRYTVIDGQRRVLTLRP